MHSFFRPIFVVLALFVVGFGPMHAAAQSAAEASKPLVIIRFNQGRVYYDKQLFAAVSKAVAIKPEVIFNIISYAPVTGDPETDAKWQATASRDTQAVIASMQNMGIPMSRIQVTGQQDPSLKYDETHIFVR